MNDKLIEVKNLKKWFHIDKGISQKDVTIKAVDNISFNIKRGEIFSMVGESGCGKTTCGKMLLKIIDPTSGSIFFNKVEIARIKQEEMKKLRRKMMIIYQDPFGSLDPRMRIGKIISEPLEVHNIGTPKEQKERVVQLMEKVGLFPDQINRYPHEFSGGQRQRIGIARALATNPEFIVADEPVSALDVSIQAQIVNLLKQLQEEFGLTLLFVAHDLSVVKHISDRVAIMYLGKIVEMAEKNSFFNNPKHPYTQLLLSSIPIPDPRIKKQQGTAMDDVSKPISSPQGCHFHHRCPKVMDICKIEEPTILKFWPDHYVACHLFN